MLVIGNRFDYSVAHFHIADPVSGQWTTAQQGLVSIHSQGNELRNCFTAEKNSREEERASARSFKVSRISKLTSGIHPEASVSAASRIARIRL